jgi:hypothetical protein
VFHGSVSAKVVGPLGENNSVIENFFRQIPELRGQPTIPEEIRRVWKKHRVTCMLSILCKCESVRSGVGKVLLGDNRMLLIVQNKLRSQLAE